MRQFCLKNFPIGEPISGQDALVSVLKGLTWQPLASTQPPCTRQQISNDQFKP